MAGRLFLVYLIMEIAALTAVGHFIGVVPTILLLIGCSAVGMLAVRGQGRRVFAQFRRAADGEIPPGTAVADGALVGLGAVLMLVPGLVTTVLGLLLVAPTRALARPLVAAFATRKIDQATMAAGYHGTVVDPSGDIVDATVVETYYDDGRGSGRPILEG